MIKTFKNKETSLLFNYLPVKKFQAFQKSAIRKLLILDASSNLGDLRALPGNKIEKLSGNRKNQYSIRINDRWRICFELSDGNAYSVEICDYH